MRNRKNTAGTLDCPDGGGKKLKLDYGQTFKVGLAFAGIILFWNAYDFVIPLLLEQTYGLPDALRGFIMGLDNLLSLFMLPLFGRLSDNAKGKLTKKFGRRTPFIVIGTICAIVLMVFVPVATLGQQAVADDYTASVEAELDNPVWMEEHLAEWYYNAVEDEGEYYEVDLEYLEANNMTREDFVGIRYDEKLTSKKALLLFGAETYFYDGVEIADMNEKAPTGRTYQEILTGNQNYNKFVASSVNGYISDNIYEKHTTTTGVGSLAVYMIILLLVLVAMASFRSPAVALMPDVTPKPLRSQANAIINLCGGIGGAIAFLIYTVVLFGERLHNYVIIFGSVAGGMFLLLAAYIALVNERKMVKRCEEICKEYGIDDYEENEGDNIDANETLVADENADEANALVADEASIQEGATENVAADIEEEEKPEISPEILEFAKAKTAKVKSPKEWWTSKDADERQRLKSFWLILASIFMWFMGYNAVSSNLSVYTTKALNLSAGLSAIISGASMIVSAIAFIPVGYMAAKIGRRKSIIIGFALAVLSFVLVCFAVRPSDNEMVPTVLFTLFYLIAGFGLIIANVNTFPMVTELSTAETVGQYTGYYYVATMSAQAITPMIGGAVMEAGQDKYLFLYSAICIVLAIVLMCFVKHGDSKQIPTGKKLTKEEKKQIRLETLDNLD